MCNLIITLYTKHRILNLARKDIPSSQNHYIMVSLLTIPQWDCIISLVLTRAALITTSSMARVSPCKRTTHEHPYPSLNEKKTSTLHHSFTYKYLYHILHFFAIRRRDDDEHGTHTTFSSPLSHPKNKKLATTLFTHSAFINTSAYTPPSHPRLGRNPSRCRRCRRPPPPSSPGRPACAPPPAGTAPRNYPSRRCTYPALSKS